MKENLQLKTLSTNKNGESSILIILIFSAVIVFLILPLFAFVFDKAIINLVSQDLVDEIQIVVYKVYPSLKKDELSIEKISVANTLLESVNEELKKLEVNPMIENIEITDILIKKEIYYSLELFIELSLVPSLYRDVINVPSKYEFRYTVLLPIDN